MIDLGLARISRLLQYTPQTWRAFHVAGTNGKGSICAYLSALLHANGSSCGRFTSPHLIDRWDCISINEKPVAETVFREAEQVVKQRDQEHGIGATEFELLTATAFEIFHREKVEYGVVEVGLGGRLDATNAMKEKVVTVISKIGLDHQSFLGNTLEEIALQKAGIMRPGVPCVVDGSNAPTVIQVIEEHARMVGTQVHYPREPSMFEALSREGFAASQIQNLECAHLAFRLGCPGGDASLGHVIEVAKGVQWQGRLQMLDITKVTGREQPVLLDGAHNLQSADALATYVQSRLPSEGKKVTWVLAASKGKDMDGILKILLRRGDSVAAVRFGPVDGMPWVKAADPGAILALAGEHGISASQRYNGHDDVLGTLKWACGEAAGGALVIAGSLYLVSDVLRLLREAKTH
ncbi:folylpolyglutamate synthase [Coniochaeta pulveracea]|uniref:Dihydrofolate synthetase n=1 Tax=Coniochaeta pulveracea TaxID=177199 RepID=A0A420Y919_9PEZI|nr:folylpolyglutamate synthase [Coniochaeta pulveracea]